MMPFFLGKNSRDSDIWDWYVKSGGRQFVWTSLHVDCLCDSVPGNLGMWPFDSDVECVIVPKEEYDKLVEQSVSQEPTNPQKGEK